MRSPVLYDARGGPITLGQELAKGGEGAVFDVQGQPNSVAKLYLKSPPREQAEKLAAMAGMAEERLLRLAAWPTGTLHDPSGQLVGFTMPKVGGSRAAFELYSPKLRLRQFPKADWRFLIHAAANAARAFAVVHEAGHIVGDVNERNLAIGQDATVRLFDCDSFQVSDGRRRWFCEVGVDTHQPPEMQGLASYRGVVRTANQDNFGLAVLIFQMLCIARHPFAGVYRSSGEAPSISAAIKEFRYAYSRDSGRTQMSPPQGSLPVEALGSGIRNLFEQAFSTAGALDGGRPTGGEWVIALGDLARNLKQCGVNAGHHHLSSLANCPWCDIEAKSGITLFPVVFVEGAKSLGIAAIWQRVSSLTDPGPMPPMPVLGRGQVQPSEAARSVGRRWRTRKAAAIGLAIVGMPIAFALALGATSLALALIVAAVALALYFRPPSGIEVERIWHALASTQQNSEKLRESWEAPHQGPSFGSAREALEAFKRSYDVLPAERARRLGQLHENRQRRQLIDHLDQFQIRNAKISGIGKARLATLQSYGIETAADLDPAKLQAIQSFGTKLVANAMAWRRQCEQSFRFDSLRGVAPAELTKIERDIAARRYTLEQQIMAGARHLEAIVDHAMARRRSLEGCLAELRPTYEQALADAAAARLVR